jgi:hypothetical protein
MALQHHLYLFDSISYILNFLPLPRPYFHLLAVLSDVTHLFYEICRQIHVFVDLSIHSYLNLIGFLTVV